MKFRFTTIVAGIALSAVAVPSMAQISSATREAAFASVGTAVGQRQDPPAAVAPIAAAQGLTVVDKPFEVPRVDPKLPLEPPPARPAPPPAPAPVVAPPPAQEWKIEASDGFLSRALRRWARDAKFPILWQAPKDLPAVPAVYRGDFLTALKRLMEDSTRSDYPLHACAYENVVRVLHDSQSCTR